MEANNNTAREGPAGQGPANGGPATDNNRQVNTTRCPLCHHQRPYAQFHALDGTWSHVCRACIHDHAALLNMIDFVTTVATRLQGQDATRYRNADSIMAVGYHGAVIAEFQTLPPHIEIEADFDRLARLIAQAITRAGIRAPEHAQQAPQNAAEPAAATQQRCSKCRKQHPPAMFRSKTGKPVKMCQWCRARDAGYQGVRRDRKKDQGDGPSQGGPRPDTSISV